MVREPSIWRSNLSHGHTRHEYRTGEPVFTAGEPTNATFCILSGRLQLTAQSEDGELTVISVLPEGSFLGESCLANQSVRSTTAITLMCSTILRIEKQAMMELVRSDPEFAYRFLISMVSRNIYMEKELVSQLFDSGEASLSRKHFIEE